MFNLIKGGNVFAPEDLGVKDVLIFEDRIVKIADKIDPIDGFETKIYDAKGKYVVPGIIDGHIHMLGAGGGGGPASRSGMVHLSAITKAGVSTAIGVLGFDCMGYTPRELLIRARALESEGLSTYMLTGSFHMPAATITNSVIEDVALMDKVIGLKIAMRDKVKATPTNDEFTKLFNDVVMGGMLGNKAGVIVAHNGEVPGSLSTVMDLMEERMISPASFIATHINRTHDILNDAIPCGKRGMILDITGDYPSDGPVMPSEALPIMLNAGVPLENITISSDSGGVFTWNNQTRMLPVDVCVKELAKTVKSGTLPMSVALAPLTSTPARVYRLSDRKGSLTIGKDADLLILDGDYNVDTLFCRGKRMVENGEAVVKGYLEAPLLETIG